MSVTLGSNASMVCVSVIPNWASREGRYAPSCPRYMSNERFSCNRKKICLITPVVTVLTVTVADCVMGVPSLAVAVAVYVVVAAGMTVALPCVGEHGLHTELLDPSTSVNAVAAPPVICQESVELCPGVMVPGDAVRLRVNGTVTVTVWGPAVPAGPVAVIEYVVVALTGNVAEPEVGSGPESSPTGMAGLMAIDVALVVVQVTVVVCPVLTSVGFAVNCVICGGTFVAT